MAKQYLGVDPNQQSGDTGLTNGLCYVCYVQSYPDSSIICVDILCHHCLHIALQ